MNDVLGYAQNSLRRKRCRRKRTKFGPLEGAFLHAGHAKKWGESKNVDGMGWRRRKKGTLGRKDNQVTGPGLWKMNCFILEEELYINEVAQMIPIWVAEGQKELADNRATWEWSKYNIRAHAIQYLKRRAKEKGYKEKCLKNEYTLASNL